MTDILGILYTYDRYELLKNSLKTMFENPGMNFRLWVLDNGSEFSNDWKDDSGKKQLRLLLDYYKKEKIELLLLNNRNVGCNHAVNQLMAIAKLQSENPTIKRPDFIFTTNDDMIYEPNWLKASYDTLLALENTEKVKIVSPFHCYHLNGKLAHGMQTAKTVEYGGQKYEIKNNVSGNTWFMRGSTWLDLFDWYPVNHPTEGADWQKLGILNRRGEKCAVTPLEMVHHAPEAQGKGEYNRLGHW